MSGEVTELTNVICPTRLIDDTPATQDRLSGEDEIGPHAKVAAAIADLILSKDECGGKIIGLEGVWGAGKTTTLNFLRQKLNSSHDVTLFLFDAWAHEGDPLRRTYLESLIRHFQSLGSWIDRDKWEKKLETLSKRRRITNTRTVSQATTLGRFFALSVLAVPLGSALLTAALRETITLDLNAPIAWKFNIGLLCAVAPFLVLFMNFLRLKWDELVTHRVITDEERALEWAFLSSTVVSETKQDTTETPEPTSIEFEDCFKELMREALPASLNKQAVLVLDNLDRVDPKDALSIWSTLQTFLQQTTARTEDWFQRLWIIVPYDPSGLRRLWENRERDNVGRRSNDPLPNNSIEFNNVVADSFLDKSFQLRFEVPLPVLSNWKSFLMRLVRHAFPMHSEDDQYMIYRVFDVNRTRNGKIPTPRELILYVNQIGAIHRQWQHAFPIGHIAYYALLSRSRRDIRADLSSGKLPEPYIKSVLSPELTADLAGLVFNVPPKLGLQLLLGDQLYAALAKNKAADLLSLQSRHENGFWPVFEEVAEQFSDADGPTLANIALCLNNSKITQGAHKNEVATVLNQLKRAASLTGSWLPFDNNLAAGLCAIFELTKEQDVIRTVMSSLRTTIKGLQSSAGESGQITDITISGLAMIVKQIVDLGFEKAVDEPLTLSVDPMKWSELATIIGHNDPNLWKFFKPAAANQEIAETFAKTIIAGQLSESTLLALKVSDTSLTKPNWDVLPKSFEQRLNAAQNPNAQETVVLLQGLYLLDKLGTAVQDTLRRLAEGGHLMHALQAGRKDLQCRALCIVAFLEQRPSAAKPQTVGNSDTGYQVLTSAMAASESDLAAAIVKILVSENKNGFLFSVIKARQAYDPLIVLCLRICADAENALILTAETMRGHWRELRTHLVEESVPDRFDKFVRYLCKASTFVEDIERADVGFRPEDALLYTAMCHAEEMQDFREWCRNGLQTLDLPHWKAELDQAGEVIRLALTLVQEGTDVSLKIPYLDALIDFAEDVLDEKVTPDDYLVARRSMIVDALEKDRKTILRRRLRDAAMDRDGKCGDRFFDMFGDEIGNFETLAESANIVAELFSPLIRERRVAGLRWLQTTFSKHPTLLSEYSDRYSVQDFRDRVQMDLTKMHNGEDESSAIIRSLGETLGIEAQSESEQGETSGSGGDEKK